MFDRLVKFFSPLRLCREWWESEIEGNCDPDKELTGPAEPVNTWSNLAYIFGGVYLIVGYCSYHSVVFAIALICLGIGSGLYHAIPSRGTAALDHFGIYAVFTMLILWGIGTPWFLMGIIGFLAAYHFRFTIETNLNSTTTVVGGLSFWAVGWSPLAIVALGLFALAFVAWILDRRRILLWRYGHGIWHVLTAAAITLMFVSRL